MTLFDYLFVAVPAEDPVLDEGLWLEDAPQLPELDLTISPADGWLSGAEWGGEAEIGGQPMTSGNPDPFGQGNDVFAVDGEVLSLPD